MLQVCILLLEIGALQWLSQTGSQHFFALLVDLWLATGTFPINVWTTISPSSST
jgi:hypothetical protein